MAKIKSKEFISSDSDSDSDDNVQEEPAASEPKGEKRKSTDPDLDQVDKSKKQKTDSDDVPKKKDPEKSTKKESESESESSDEEAKKKEPPPKKEPEKNTEKKLSASESESSDEEEKKKKKKAKKEKKKKSKEKSEEGGSKKKEKKKAPKTTVTRKPEGNARKGFDLGRDRKISVSEFKGRRYVNIREYYDAGGGEMRPGKRGTSLSREQWDMLTQVKDEVNKAVASDDKFWDLGRNKRVSLNEFKGNVLFDIREYYDAQGQMKPGKKGISLSREQWNMVHAVEEEITDAII